MIINTISFFEIPKIFLLETFSSTFVISEIIEQSTINGKILGINLTPQKIIVLTISFDKILPKQINESNINTKSKQNKKFLILFVLSHSNSS